MGNTPASRRVPLKPAPGRAGRRGLGLVCALAFPVLWPGAATTEELAWGDVATPLRIVNLNPFRLLYGVPGSLGAHVMTPSSSELIASMDMASHLIEASSGAERVLIDGETYRQGLALRHGFGNGWEYLFEASALSHRAGAFDGFIETWHDVFHLPQGDRDRAARDRLALVYANGEPTTISAKVFLRSGISASGWAMRCRIGPFRTTALRSGAVSSFQPAMRPRWPVPAVIRPRSGRRPQARCQDPPARAAGYTAQAWERLPGRRRADFRTLATALLPSDILA